MTHPWGWMPPRSEGIWRYGPVWLRGFSAAVPWITVGVLLLMFQFASGTLSLARGVRFDLPAEGLHEAELTSLVALVMPSDGAPLLFFDDVRYSLADESATAAFGDHLLDRVSGLRDRSLLLLADRRVSGGDLMRVVSAARRAGVTRVLVAERREEAMAE